MPLKGKPENFPSFMLISMSYIAPIFTPIRRFCGSVNRVLEHACAIAAFYLLCSSIYYPAGPQLMLHNELFVSKNLIAFKLLLTLTAIFHLLHL